ncbi:phage tail tube protein [Nocardia concava]|uniref:phage tail tube protein n=1 Tax=Nocardia concava TaxID=257281 RepID=UPI0003193421|nr:IPT/TIG domain-containing protein [Nocardia concava]
MAGASVAKIGVGAPNKATGGVLVAPAGTTLPVGVSGDVSTWTKLAYVADDGLRPSGDRSSTDIYDWSGDLIYSPQDQHSTAFQLKLIAAFDSDVLSEAFGAANVTTVGSLTTVKETGDPLGVHPWVFDMRDNAKKARIVVPAGQITAVKEDPMVRNGLQAFDVTLTCYKDDTGVKAYRYYDTGATPSAPTISAHLPATVGVAGGDLLELTGTNFTGTTGATVGGTAATKFFVVNDQTLIITVPAKSAGSYPVIVTNAVGPSAGHNVTFA